MGFINLMNKYFNLGLSSLSQGTEKVKEKIRFKYLKQQKELVQIWQM